MGLTRTATRAGAFAAGALLGQRYVQQPGLLPNLIFPNHRHLAQTYTYSPRTSYWRYLIIVDNPLNRSLVMSGSRIAMGSPLMCAESGDMSCSLRPPV
jgi:hypothetical protein